MRRSRRCARWRSGSQGGSASARASRRRSSTSSRAGTDGDSRTPAATRSRCRCVSCTWRGTSPSSSPPPAPTRHAGRRRAPNGRRVRASARRARRAQLRRPPRRPGRDADVGAGAGDRAVPADLDRGRTGRRRLHGHRRAHRSQVTVASRALDGRGRARRGRRLAHGPPGSFRDARAARRARARPRPRRRVECDLGEAGAASGSENGSGCDSTRTSPSAPSPSRRRSLRSGCWPAHTTNGSTAPATTAARAGRRSIRQPASSPPPTATGRCARRGRTGRLSMRRRQRRS